MATPTVTVHDDIVYGGFTVVGIVLIIIGEYLRQSYAYSDSLRTAKVSVPINSITKYDVEYRSTRTSRFNTKIQRVYNVAPANIKPAGDIYSFIDSNTSLPLTLPIAEVFRTVSEIQVTINNEPVEIDKKNFTRTLEETDVGKDIDLEYEPGNMKTNISMVTEGLTSGESWTVYGLIVAGAILILIMLSKILRLI